MEKVVDTAAGGDAICGIDTADVGGGAVGDLANHTVLFPPDEQSVFPLVVVGYPWCVADDGVEPGCAAVLVVCVGFVDRESAQMVSARD